MQTNRKKKFYVGGMISLIVLPILFLGYTNKLRQEAKYCGSIAFVSQYEYPRGPDTSYTLVGKDDIARISNFERHLNDIARILDRERQLNDNRKIRIYVFFAKYPKNCSYGFAVKMIDVLQQHSFTILAIESCVVYYYDPIHVENGFIYKQPTLSEEYDYLATQVTKVGEAIRYQWNIDNEPVYKPRKEMTYSDALKESTYSDDEWTTHTTHTIIDDPWFKFLFERIGAWTWPIALCWLLLLVLSIRRQKRVVVA